MPIDNEVKEKKKYYYKTIVVSGIDPERARQSFDQQCNEFAKMYDVESSTSGFAYANTNFVFTMTFCCEMPSVAM